jgi:glutaminyl-tRNA synthetase
LNKRRPTKKIIATLKLGAMAAAMNEADMLSLCSRVGLSEAQTATVLKKPAIASALALSVGKGSASGEASGLLFSLVTKVPATKYHLLPFVGRYIVEGKVNSTSKVHAASNFIKAHGGSIEEIDAAAFEAASGVGVDVTDTEVTRCVDAVVASVRATLEEERYTFPISTLLVAVRERFPHMAFADGRTMKDCLDGKILEVLGPRTAEDDARAASGKKSKGGKDSKKDTAPTPVVAASSASAEAAPAETLSSVRDVFVARDLASAKNSERLLKEHMEVTKGVLRTRFPPEPNGFLHIGHAKSLNLNFNLAFKIAGCETPGDTIFRYDDTNPEAESQEYIDSQADNVSWMGWKPCCTTFSSDYFEVLHDLAVKLIKDGKAYVCHQTAEEMAASREKRRSGEQGFESPWRNRPMEESLYEFAKMREGRYAEGTAVLRLKMDWSSPNPNMWDLIAYRIKYHPHPHRGSDWCIYPSYDYTHCIVDSLEHIDYSLCTLEFEPRRDSYYWLLEALDMWRPRVWEFSRLNICRNVLSKRKILKLVKMGVVRGWDDPRLLTLNGIRRRGFPPPAINAFCDDIGVTRTENVIHPHKLEFHVRTFYDSHAARAFAVLEPLRVEITNLGEGECFTVEAPVMPKDDSKGTRTMHLSKFMYVERSDFREEDDKSFFGLAPHKTVGLRYAGLLTCTGVHKNARGDVTGLSATYRHERDSKPKGNLHWVSSAPGSEPARAEVRLYEDLFTTNFPGEATGNFLDDLNPHSERTLKGAVIEPSLDGAPTLAAFQFERLGFFVVDQDSSSSTGMVFNRTVTLRESVSAKELKASS